MNRPNVMVLRTAGTNCDEETVHAWELAGATPRRVHIRELIDSPNLLGEFEILTIPGGFSYGDDIAAGKILASQMVHHLAEPIRAFVDRGGLVLGICNGFQVLTEAHLLPGALLRNKQLAFSCRWVDVRVEKSRSMLLAEAQEGTVWQLPIAHGEGHYFADHDTLELLEANEQVVLRYCAPEGFDDPSANPNGSSHDIAGICNRQGNVLGLMPHPERAAEEVLGGDDGRLFLAAVVASWQARARPASVEGLVARQ